MSAETLVFVYGTLMRGQYNHVLLQRSPFLGRAATAPRYTLIDLGRFPGMIAGGTVGIHGEVYSVNAETLAAIDRLEGHPNFYVRTEIALADGRTVQAYVLSSSYHSRGTRIESGDWRAHAENKYLTRAF